MATVAERIKSGKYEFKTKEAEQRWQEKRKRQLEQAGQPQITEGPDLYRAQTRAQAAPAAPATRGSAAYRGLYPQIEKEQQRSNALLADNRKRRSEMEAYRSKLAQRQFSFTPQDEARKQNLIRSGMNEQQAQNAVVSDLQKQLDTLDLRMDKMKKEAKNLSTRDAVAAVMERSPEGMAYAKDAARQKELDSDYARRQRSMAAYEKELSTRLYAPMAQDEARIAQIGAQAWRKELEEQVLTLQQRQKQADTASDRQKLKDYSRRQEERRRALEDVLGAPDKQAAIAAAPKNSRKMSDEVSFAVDYLTDRDYRRRMGNEDRLNYATQEERETLLYYAGRGDRQHAKDYLDSLTRTLNARQQADTSEKVKDFANEHKIVGGAANILGSFAAPAAYAETVGQFVKNKVTGGNAPVDPNAPAMSGAHLVSDTAEGITRNMNPAGKFMTETGLSIAQNMARLPLGPAAGLATMGLSAAGQTALDSAEKGASAGQTLALSTMAGAFEVLSEKIPLDNMFRLMRGGAGTGLKNTVKEVLKQMGTEATEETVTEIANRMAENVVMANESEMNRYIREKTAQGISPEDAKKAAFLEYFVKQPALAGLGGAVSGGIMGGGGTMIGRFSAQGRENAAQESFSAVEKRTAAENMAAENAKKRAAFEAERAMRSGEEIAFGEEPEAMAQAQQPRKLPYGPYWQGNAQEREANTAAPQAQQPQKLPYGPYWQGNAQEQAQQARADTQKQPIEFPAAAAQTQAQQAPTGTEGAAKSFYSMTQEEQREANRKGQEIAESVAKATGRKLIWSDDPQLANGKYDTKSGTITLSKNMANPVLFVFKHELTHSIEGTQEYAKLQNQILKSPELLNFAREQGATIGELARAKQLSYAEKGVELTAPEAMHEVVADYIGSNLFTNEKSIMTLARENRSLATRIWDFLKGMKTKVFGTPEERWVMKAEELYRKALKAAPAAKENAAREGGEKYALTQYSEKMKQNWAGSKQIVIYENQEQLDQFVEDALNNKVTDRKMYFGRISPELADRIEIDTGIRVDGYNCTLRGSEIRKILLYSHGDAQREALRGQRSVTKEDIYNIPQVIQSPDKISLSDTLFEGKPVINFEKTINGRTVVAAYVSKKHFDLTVQTMYSGKAKRNLSTTPSEQKLFSQTPETLSGTVPFEDSISTNKGKSQEDSQEKYSMGETFDREYRGLWEKYGEQITAERGQRRTDAPLGSAITKKSEDYLKSKTTKAAKALAKAMNIPYSAEKGQIKTALAEAMTEISEKGGLSAESSDALFEKAYQAGVMVLDDYYNQYKDLRKEISQTRFAVTESDKEEFADWAEFRKKNFGKILTSKDGIPIDTKYMELNEEYPEMFPQTITRPGDQLRRIAEVRVGIEKTEIDLSQYKGEEAEEFKKFARHEFDRIMNDMIDEVNVAKRYEEDRAASKAAEKILGLLPEEVREAYERDKTLKKAESKAKRLNLLTKDDRNTVDRLLRGELTLDQLPQGSNKKGIKAVFEAEKARTENMKPVMQYRADLRESRTARAEEIIANADLWKDKANGLLYSRETAERNMRDITKNKADADRLIEAYFKPVHVNEAKSLRLQNDLRGKIRDLKIGADEAYDLTYQTPDKETVTGKASESALVQLLGEGVITEKQVEECGADAGKIKAAVETMREIYNDLFEQINASLISNGYLPADYRKDYFPHFDKYRPESVLSKIFHKMGMEINEDKLPTDIAGLTHTFRPGKKWFGNLLQRTGTATDYDALEGFDRYLNTAADVIFHTGDIQNLRALENAMRYKFSSGGTKEEIDRLKARKDLDELVKEQMIQDLYERDNTKFGNFATWLRNYTDNLAGKKAIGDRVFEQGLGRAVYDGSKKLEGRIAANMVALNPGSWLTNFIPLTQGGAQLKATSMLKAMQDTVKAYARDDGFSDASDFLTGRKGTQLLALSKADKFADFFSKPMTLIDDFTSNTLVRARYAENLKAGMTQDQALREADSWTAGVMADRSKGSMPTIFNRKNPLIKPLTMFQLEVNNQYSYLFKDIPREEKEKGILMLAWTMTKFFVGARIFNEIYRRLVGRNAAFDPFQILQDAVANFNDPNMSSSKAIGILEEDIAEQIPFIGGFWGGGRLPISNALPARGSLTKLTDDISPKKKGEIVKREILEKPVAYLALPFGGGQVKKLSQGIDLMRQGGSFTYDNEGNKRLQFLADQDFTTALKVATFGKYATKQAQEYVDSNFYTYTAKATAAITSAKDHGLEPQRVKKIVDDMRKMNISRNKEGSGTSAAELKMNYLFKQKDLNEEQRSWLGEELARNSAKTPYDYSTQAAMQISMIGGKAPEKAKKAEEAGIDNETYLAAYEAQKKSFGTGSGIPAAKMKKKAIDEATPDLTGTQRRLLYELFEVRKDAWGN